MCVTRHILVTSSKRQTDAVAVVCVCLALSLERPVSVKYNVDTQTLTFQSPASNELCLHVRVLSASTSAWTSQLHCTALSSGAVKLHDNVDNVNAVEVSFCVQRRTDVCGPAHNATIGQYSRLAL